MRRLALLAVVSMLTVFAAVPASAARPFPDTIPLPDGFRPEGIAIGKGHTFYAGSIPTGAIYKGNLRTGEGGVLVPAVEGRAAIGLAVDRKERLFVAGGPTGDAFVYDGRTGELLAHYDFVDDTTFVNDVVVTKDGAWFTDSMRAVLYHIPVSRSGELGSAETLALTGDFQLQPGFNLNGIDATANGKTLVVVQSGTGMLFTVDPNTGVTEEIDLGGESVPMGDGILLEGRTLYVVQNRLNLVAKIRLSSRLDSGTVISRTSDDDFDVPTTVDRFGGSLYLVNARFTTAPTPDTEYWITRIDRP